MPTSAWGTTIKTPERIDFKAIMDETLAKELEAKENQTQYKPDGLEETELGQDFALAMQLQNEEDSDHVDGEIQVETDLDPDFALAMQLQAEETRIYEQHQLQQRQNLSQKIQFQYQVQPNVQKYINVVDTSGYDNAQREAYGQSSELLVHANDMYNEDEVEDENTQQKPNAVRNQTRQVAHLQIKKSINSADIVTKHDLNFSGQRNADNLERRHGIAIGENCLVPNKAFNALNATLTKKEKIKGVRAHGRVETANRATKEGVLDEKTKLLLLKMTNRGEIDQVFGVIQTGKEASVYYAVGTDPENLKKVEYAVKIFRTTLNEFSNRVDYVNGDKRFDRNFHKKSDIRQTNEWAEKEFANLHRVYRSGIPSPKPLLVKDHILLMSLIGREGWPAPQLKDAEIGPTQAVKCYAQIIRYVRVLYQEAKLVHADLSEYNILYFAKKCWFIDFGQAVEIQHPSQLDYLQRDLSSVNALFAKGGLVPVIDNLEEGLLDIELLLSYVTTPDTLHDIPIPTKMRELLESVELFDRSETTKQ